jgi:hypothetical protein
MKQITLEVDAITVIQAKDNFDEIFIHLEGPPPFPKWIHRPPILSMKVTEGGGVEYVREVFGMEPEVISGARGVPCHGQ